MTSQITLTADSPNLVIHADNGDVLPSLADGAFQMIYVDPPFNTGKRQSRQSLKTARSATGSRVGFEGKTYETVKGVIHGYDDVFVDYWGIAGAPSRGGLASAGPDRHLLFCTSTTARCTTRRCSWMFCSGGSAFLNEIIWAYDYGARSKKKWPGKHDNILVYAKDRTLRSTTSTPRT